MKVVLQKDRVINIYQPVPEEATIYFLRNRTLDLFRKCSQCKEPTHGVIRHVVGTAIQVTQHYQFCGCRGTWNRQLYKGKFKMPDGSR